MQRRYKFSYIEMREVHNRHNIKIFTEEDYAAFKEFMENLDIKENPCISQEERALVYSGESSKVHEFTAHSKNGVKVKCSLTFSLPGKHSIEAFDNRILYMRKPWGWTLTIHGHFGGTVYAPTVDEAKEKALHTVSNYTF